MDRTLLGLARGDRREGIQLQWADAGGDPLALAPLHDEAKVGTFAVVYRGRVAHGSWHVPVAIKVQRDEPRTPEDADSAVARFDAEATLHRDRLRRPDGDGRAPLPVVAHIELATTAGGEADRIPPSILCRRAAHALALLCPTCGAELESPEDRFDAGTPAAPPAAGRVLVCPNSKCPGPWKDTPDARRTLHAAAVARQVGPCGGCERFGGPADACLPDSRILNFFPARLLVFELLGESLAQFLRRPPPAGPRFPPRADGRTPRPREWLTTACHLLSDVLDGMEFLHAREVWHLDLKPDNVCLRAAPDRPRGVLIDLGLAGDPAAPAKFREATAALPLETDYAPAELRRPTLSGTYEVEKRNGNRARVRFDLPSAAAGDPTDPVLLVGETAGLTGGGRTIRGTVEQVVGTQAVFAFAAGDPADRGSLTVYRATGPAADYFSFGLLAAALLVRRPELPDLRDLARNLEVALRELDKVRPLADCPGREVVRRLAAARNHTGFLQPFLRLHADIRKDYGDAAFLAEELLGLALRCLARGVAGWSASEHRAACPDDARRRVRRTLDGLRAAAATAELGEQWAAAEQSRKERAALLRRMATAGRLTWPTSGGGGDPDCLREVVALLPAEPTAESVEVRHAAHLYGKAAGHFAPHLDSFFDAPKADADDGPLVHLLRWARAVAPGEGELARLLELRRPLLAPPPGVREQWLPDADRIAVLRADCRAAALQVRSTLAEFRALVYERAERAGARVYIGDEAAHGRIDMAAAARAAASVAGGFLDRLVVEREKLVRDGTAVLNRWQATAAPVLRVSLFASEKKLETGLQRVDEEDKAWAVSLSRDAAVVSKYLTAITKTEPAGLWTRWVAEAERPLSFLERNLWGASRQVELTPAEAGPNPLDKAADAVNRILRDPLPLGPAVAAACRLLLAEYDTVSRSRQLTRG